MDFHIHVCLFNGMKNNPTSKSYVVGFALSLLFTLAAYFLVANRLLSGGILTFTILGLALFQLVVQLLFFLHLGQESKPRWNLVIFLSTVSIILIIVLGSIWIMNNFSLSLHSPGKIAVFV